MVGGVHVHKVHKVHKVHILKFWISYINRHTAPHCHTWYVRMNANDTDNAVSFIVRVYGLMMPTMTMQPACPCKRLKIICLLCRRGCEHTKMVAVKQNICRLELKNVCVYANIGDLLTTNTHTPKHTDTNAHIHTTHNIWADGLHIHKEGWRLFTCNHFGAMWVWVRCRCGSFVGARRFWINSQKREKNVIALCVCIATLTVNTICIKSAKLDPRFLSS